MFNLIEFQNNKTVAVVPQSWYSDGVTFWPDYKCDDRVDRAVKNAEGLGWKTYDVRVIQSCGIASSDCRSDALQDRDFVKPCHASNNFFGDSDDDSEKESPPKKTARGPTTNSKVAPPPPLPLSPSPPQLKNRRPAGEETPSASQVYRPTWRGGRCGSDTIGCSAAQVHIMSLLENMKHQQDQLIARVNYLTNKLHTTGQETSQRFSGWSETRRKGDVVIFAIKHL